MIKTLCILTAGVIVAAIAGFLIGSMFHPRPTHAADSAPVIMVHGCCGGTPAVFNAMAAQARAAGYTVYAPAMPSDTNPIVNAQALKTFVDGLNAPKVHIVAHSMGGLEARYMIKNLGEGAKVVDLTMIDTPNYGLWLLCFVQGGYMCPGSSFLSQLNAGDDTPGATRYVQLMGQVDTTILDGGVCYAHIAGDHGTLPSQPDVIGKTMTALAGGCPGTLH